MFLLFVCMRLWFVPLNVLVAAFCFHGIAQEHHPLGRFYSNANRQGNLRTVPQPHSSSSAPIS